MPNVKNVLPNRWPMTATLGSVPTSATRVSPESWKAAAANDYAQFLQMLLNGGTLDGKRYLGPSTLCLMTADHANAGAGVVPGPLYLPGAGYGFGLGFAVRRAAGEAPYPSEAGEYYWGGAGGTYMWVDPKSDMFVVFMMQSPKNRSHYRSLIRNMVYAAVLK